MWEDLKTNRFMVTDSVITVTSNQVRRSLAGRSNNPIEVLFGRVLKNPDPILQAEMGQFGRKLIHIYKKLFEDLKSAIDQRKEKPELPDDRD